MDSVKGFLLETIRCESGRLLNLEWHRQRMARSRLALLGLGNSLELGDIPIPPQAREGIFKCRVLYDSRIWHVEFTPYRIRPVRSLKLVAADGLEYGHKYAGRAGIGALFEKRGAADDILMIKDGLLADTSYANIALYDGSAWHTPARPLLPGTRREALIAAGKLTAADIPPGCLGDFQEIRLINAMMGLEEGPGLKPANVY